MEEEKPNYYAVIPASVRYNENLNSSQKIFYSEITALTQKTGECWASNNYFARLYKVSPSSISNWVKKLEKEDFITVEYKKKGKEIEKRIIKIKGIQNIDYLFNKLDEGIQNIEQGYSKNLKENNTSINNININNKKEIYKEKEICKRVIDRLNELNNTKYSATSENTLKFIKGRLNDGYTEEDLLLVVEKMSYLWHQPNEKDMTLYLRPSTLFRPTNFENYLNMPVKVKKTTKNVKLDLDILNRKGD